jgi:hypothetical protein
MDPRLQYPRHLPQITESTFSYAYRLVNHWIHYKREITPPRRCEPTGNTDAQIVTASTEANEDIVESNSHESVVEAGGNRTPALGTIRAPWSVKRNLKASWTSRANRSSFCFAMRLSSQSNERWYRGERTALRKTRGSITNRTNDLGPRRFNVCPRPRFIDIYLLG